MSFSIKSGDSGNVARVDGRNRLTAKAVTVGRTADATKRGESFNINTGLVELTSANETAVLYVKNTSTTRKIAVESLVFGAKLSTGGDGSGVIWTVEKNPTGGTIVTPTPSDADIVSNRNFGSGVTLSADVYKGAEGETLTGGTDHLIVVSNDLSRSLISIDEILDPGNSIGVLCDPEASNTSMFVYVAMICHLVDEQE